MLLRNGNFRWLGQICQGETAYICHSPVNVVGTDQPQRGQRSLYTILSSGEAFSPSIQLLHKIRHACTIDVCDLTHPVDSETRTQQEKFKYSGTPGTCCKQETYTARHYIIRYSKNVFNAIKTLQKCIAILW